MSMWVFSGLESLLSTTYLFQCLEVFGVFIYKFGDFLVTRNMLWELLFTYINWLAVKLVSL